MPRRVTNLVLLAAVTTLLASGVLAWLAPDAAADGLDAVHRIAGVAFVLSLAWKYGIARRSVRRRGLGRRGVLLGVATAVLTVVTVAIGIAWTLGAVSFDRPLAYSALNIHVIAGLVLSALVVAHALVRGEQTPALPDLVGRRTVVRALALLAASFVVSAAFDGVALARRFTGSRHAGSFTGNAMPVTIWAFDKAPAIDVDEWRLRITGSVARPAALSYAELDRLPRADETAVLDCTGGWWSEQAWTGVRLGDLLSRHGAASEANTVEVISVTGHAWTFAREEIGRALIATHVRGETISPDHGYPARLVVPGRRGFLWIKWVSEVRVGRQ
jgi:DMSO/TMAO reductase YedYZ molybdopterin-dependent catalytic subunit